MLFRNGSRIAVESLFENLSYTRNLPLEPVAIEIDAEVFDPVEFEVTRRASCSWVGGIETVWDLSRQSVPLGEVLENILDHRWL